MVICESKNQVLKPPILDTSVYSEGFCFFRILVFTKVESQIDQLQKDSLGNIGHWTLVLEVSILAQIWFIIGAQIKVNCWVFPTNYWMV